MEFISKLIELLGTSIMWLIALVLLSIGIFGGSISIQIDGLNKIIQRFWS